MSEGILLLHPAFDAEPGVPAEIEQNVRIMDNVLRFLCVRQEEA